MVIKSIEQVDDRIDNFIIETFFRVQLTLKIQYFNLKIKFLQKSSALFPNKYSCITTSIKDREVLRISLIEKKKYKYQNCRYPHIAQQYIFSAIRSFNLVLIFRFQTLFQQLYSSIIHQIWIFIEYFSKNPTLKLQKNFCILIVLLSYQLNKINLLQLLEYYLKQTSQTTIFCIKNKKKARQAKYFENQYSNQLSFGKYNKKFRTLSRLHNIFLFATVAKINHAIILKFLEQQQGLQSKKIHMSNIFLDECSLEQFPAIFPLDFEDQNSRKLENSQVPNLSHSTQQTFNKKKRLDNNAAREYQQIALKIIKKIGLLSIVNIEKYKKQIWKRGTLIFLMAEMKKVSKHQIFMDEFQAQIDQKNVSKLQQLKTNIISQEKYDFDVSSNVKALQGCKLYLEDKYFDALVMVFVSQKGKMVRQKSNLIKDWLQLQKLHCSGQSQEQNFSNQEKI